MPTLAITDFNIVCATLGGFITVFGLVSFLLKERFYLSEALISFLAGTAFSPHAANFIRPLDYAGGVQGNIDYVTLYFSRLVLGVQLVIAGVQLPSRYLKLEWRSLSILLGPGMGAMWISSSLLIWALVPNLTWLHALAVAACITPTDPILSNSIVKGKFADMNIPKELQKIIIAESGANDGLGYPFLFLPLYLMKYAQDDGLGQPGSASKAMGHWFGDTWGYTIILGVIYGVVVGWLAKELLHYAEERKYVDRENFLVFAITLALFIIGTCGMIGSDDVLACFVAGNVFTWDDWFRLETMDDSLQPTVDMLLNVSVFLWYGAIAPWVAFRTNNVIPIYRLIPLGIMILLFRRLPFVFLVHKHVKQIEHWQQALFVGFFGPIGVSAIFYLYVSLDFLERITYKNEVREDAKRLQEVMIVVIWFAVTCSIVVHGLSVPVGKFFYNIPRTVSSVLSMSQERTSSENLPLSRRARIRSAISFDRNRASSRAAISPSTENVKEPPRPVFRPGGTQLRTGQGAEDIESGMVTPVEGLDPEAFRMAAGTHTSANNPDVDVGDYMRHRMIKFADSTREPSPEAAERQAGRAHNIGRTADREA